MMPSTCELMVPARSPPAQDEPTRSSTDPTHTLRGFPSPRKCSGPPRTSVDARRRHRVGPPAPGQAESQRIARKDPLHLRGRRAQRRPDRRNPPDSEHRRIEKGGETRSYADDDFPADGRTELGGFGRRCDCVGQDRYPPAASDVVRRVSGGRNPPKCSRSVDVEYSVRYAPPRSCSSGINQSTISSSPVGTRYGEMLKPSEAPLRTQWTN